MALRSLEATWDGFAEAVFVGLEPSKVQREEMRRAFYAGAWSVIRTLNDLESASYNQQQCADHLLSIARECIDFKNRLKNEPLDASG